MIPSPVLPTGSDYVRAPDGFQCSQSTAPTAYLDGGMFVSDRDRSEYGAYARVVIPIGGTSNRPDCKQLFDFEMQHRNKTKLLEGLKSEIFN